MTQSNNASSKHMSAAEMERWIKDNDRKLRNYEAALDPLKKMKDVTKSTYKSVTSVTKETVITYLQNPTRNESNLRNLSWYLYYRSQVYQRIVTYYSTLFCLEARSVIPDYDLVNPQGDDQMLSSYNDTLNIMKNWNISNEFLKVYFTCFLQDVSYNVAYYDETGLYLLPLPADYCKVFAQYSTGDFAFAMDMSYFKGTNEWLLEAWGEPFISMNNEYQKTSTKWQTVPDEYAACFKYRSYDWETVMPVFSGLFGELINLSDISDVQAVADQMDIYKLLWIELETITGSKIPDDWKVNPDIVIEYFNRIINEALPDYTSAAIVPGKLNVIDFSNIDKTSETNKVLTATKTLLNSSGGAQILNSADISGTTAFTAAVKADTEFAIGTLLPQTEGWFNRILGNVVNNPSQVHFYHTGRLTRNDLKDELLQNAQYSLPTKLAVMSLLGLNEIQTLSLNHLEEDILKLSGKFNSPLQSSYTQSSNDVGRPTSNDSDLTDDGEASRDKTDNKT